MIARTVSTMRRGSARSGFSLIEILIALVMAGVVLAAATNFSVRSWQARRGWTVREGVDRGARFVGLSIARDAQEAGIGMESTPTFASLDAAGDTVSILSIPFTPHEAPVYPIYDDGGEDPNYPAGGTCGSDCIDFLKVGGTFTLAAGKLARLQVGGERRLLFLTSVVGYNTTRFRVRFKPMSRLLGRESGLDSLLLSRAGTSIQEVNAVVYWRDPGAGTLHRAQSFNADGTPRGFVIATDVETFDPLLLFVGGREARTYDGVDADTTNDGNKLIGIKVRARIRSDKLDPTVNGGAPYRRWYEWRVAPRNLLYEKNRMG